MNTTRVSALILALAFTPSVAWAAVTSISASKDNTIYQNGNNLSAGGGAGIFTGTTLQGSKRRGLLAFDVAASVPAGSVITGTQLTLYLGLAANETPSTSNVTVGLHKLAKDWGEGTAGSSNPSISHSGAGFAASAGDATWSDAKLGSNAWANLGATGDFSPTASASQVVGGPNETSFTWLSTSALIGDVQNWLNAPTTNFGWALINSNEGSNSSVKAFYSRSATQNSNLPPNNTLNVTWRPTLLVTYVPEPSSAMLCLLVGMLAYLRRRR